MNMALALTVLLSTLTCSIAVVAAPHVFAPGQPARATEVNENFADLEVQISQNAADIQTNALAIQNLQDGAATVSGDVAFDYRDFAESGAILRKTFRLTGEFCGDREVLTYSRTAAGADTQIRIVRQWDSAGVVCHWDDFQYLATPAGYQLRNSGIYDPAGTFVGTYTLEAPIIVRGSAMRQGASFADATRVDYTPVGGSTDFYGVLIQTSSALGIADVTVPAGSFAGCLKMGVLRTSNSLGAFHRVSWLCPGVGEVKRIQMGINLTNPRIWELMDIEYVAP